MRVRLDMLYFQLESTVSGYSVSNFCCSTAAIISDFSKTQNGLSFWYQLTQIVQEKRSSNECCCIVASTTCRCKRNSEHSWLWLKSILEAVAISEGWELGIAGVVLCNTWSASLCQQCESVYCLYILSSANVSSYMWHTEWCKNLAIGE